MDIQRESLALILLVEGLTLQAQVDLPVDQLHTKDEQIEKINENMHKQAAVHIQNLYKRTAGEI